MNDDIDFDMRYVWANILSWWITREMITENWVEAREPIICGVMKLMDWTLLFL